MKQLLTILIIFLFLSCTTRYNSNDVEAGTTAVTYAPKRFYIQYDYSALISRASYWTDYYEQSNGYLVFMVDEGVVRLKESCVIQIIDYYKYETKIKKEL